MTWHTDEECYLETLLLDNEPGWRGRGGERDKSFRQRIASVEEAGEWLTEHGEARLLPLVLQHLNWAMTRSEGEPPLVGTEQAVAVAYRLFYD